MRVSVDYRLAGTLVDYLDTTPIPWRQSLVLGHAIQIDPAMGRRIAAAYDSLPVDARASAETIATWQPYSTIDPVVACYSALAGEVNAQYRFIQSAGYHLEPWIGDGQPYADSAAMIHDVRANHHLSFFTGGEYHPLLGIVDPATGLSDNDRFRAVHDVFGHAVNGYQFGPNGEYNAWIAHSQVFSALAQRAMSTETTGQNCWVNWHADHADRPIADRPYAIQKVALLPLWATDYHAVMRAHSATVAYGNHFRVDHDRDLLAGK